MCGKFTARASWREINSQRDLFVKALAARQVDPDDQEITYRVMGNLPVITLDRETGAQTVQPMRWGFPDPKDWHKPRPIHARSETIETTKAFAGAFLDGQRGIVLFKSFCEAPDVEGPTQQHVITPGDEQALAAAFVWRSFDVGLSVPLVACCLVTVPANVLIATLPTDRMPAFLALGDWGKWLGEEAASVDDVKACLTPVEGVRWTMTKEEKAAKPRQKPTVSDPKGLF